MTPAGPPTMPGPIMPCPAAIMLGCCCIIKLCWYSCCPRSRSRVDTRSCRDDGKHGSGHGRVKDVVCGHVGGWLIVWFLLSQTLHRAECAAYVGTVGCADAQAVPLPYRDRTSLLGTHPGLHANLHFLPQACESHLKKLVKLSELMVLHLYLLHVLDGVRKDRVFVRFWFIPRLN